MPDSILDVIDGGFGTIPALGLQDLRYGVGTHRKWKLKDTPVTCSDTVLLASPRRLRDCCEPSFRGRIDVPHPDPQRCLFLWACRLVSAGKGFNNGFFRATHLRLLSAGFFLDFNASEGMPVSWTTPSQQSNPTRASDRHRRSPVSRMSLSSSMACRRRSFASSMRPATLA